MPVRRLYVLPPLIFFWAKRTQDLLDQFSLYGRYLAVESDLAPFSWWLNGRCYRNQFCGRIGKIELFTFILQFVAVAFWKRRIALSPFWFWKAYLRLSGYTVNLVNFGPVTPEFKRVVSMHLPHLKNISFDTNYLRMYWLIFTKFSQYVRHLL